MARYDGKTNRRRFKKLKIREVSMVDRPAQGEGARVAIMKRADDELEKNRMALSTLTAGHAHAIILVQANNEGMAELKAGQTSYAEGHVHDWVMDDAGNIILADAEGHSHGLSVLVKDSDLSPDDGASASRSDKGLQAANSPAEAVDAEGTPSQDINMTDTKKTDAEVAAEAVQKQLDELTQKSERQAAVISLSPEQRAHFDQLEGEAADGFLKAENKDEIVKNAASEDPVVHTDLDGNEYRKSVDPTVLRLVKSNDDLRKQALVGEAIAKRGGLVKRASDELEHLTGDIDAKADLLGAVDSIEDTAKREAVVAILKSKDAGMAKAFEEVGTSDAGSSTGNPKADADAQIRAIAKKLQEADSTLTSARAYVKALDTTEGRQLHKQLAG